MSKQMLIHRRVLTGPMTLESFSGQNTAPSGANLVSHSSCTPACGSERGVWHECDECEAAHMFCIQDSLTTFLAEMQTHVNICQRSVFWQDTEDVILDWKWKTLESEHEDVQCCVIIVLLPLKTRVLTELDEQRFMSVTSNVNSLFIFYIIIILTKKKL